MQAREAVTMEEGGRLVSRVGTNAHRAEFLRALCDAGLLPLADWVEGYHEDRAHGGLGYRIVWKEGVAWEEVREGIERL